MKIAIGCDHGGYELKETVKKHLVENGIEVKDFGTLTGEAVDYPDIAVPVAEAVLTDEFDFGILICGTGIGISIAANKVKGIRCALVSEEFSARATRQHNNANILAMGGRTTGPSLAVSIVDAFLSAEFEGGRHQKRIDKISAIEG